LESRSLLTTCPLIKMITRESYLFIDRVDAGVLLAKKLLKFRGKSAAVLGIPNGGVIVAKTISDKLNLKLGVVVTKKLSAPGQPELAIGAIGPEGVLILDKDVVNELGVEGDYLEREVKKKTDKVVQRLIKFGVKDRKFAKKTIILVDDGIASGSTCEVAVKYLRKKKVGRLILAVPVAPEDTVQRLSKLVDEMVVLYKPHSFSAVGQFYKEFDQVTDEEVERILKNKRTKD